MHFLDNNFHLHIMGQVLYTVSTWKSLVSGATTYTPFFGKMSSQLSLLYCLGTENHRHNVAHPTKHTYNVLVI